VCSALLCLTVWCVQNFYFSSFDVPNTFMSHRLACPEILCLAVLCVSHFYVSPFDVCVTFTSYRLVCPALLLLTVYYVQHFYVSPFGVSSYACTQSKSKILIKILYLVEQNLAVYLCLPFPLLPLGNVKSSLKF